MFLDLEDFEGFAFASVVGNVCPPSLQGIALSWKDKEGMVEGNNLVYQEKRLGYDPRIEVYHLVCRKEIEAYNGHHNDQIDRSVYSGPSPREKDIYGEVMHSDEKEVVVPPSLSGSRCQSCCSISFPVSEVDGRP